MSRTLAALAMLLGLATPAFADQPRFCVPPLTPVVRDARLEVGAQVTSTGLYAVTGLELDMQLDPRTSLVRITVGTGSDSTRIDAIPTAGHVELTDPNLRSHLGTVEVMVAPLARDCGEYGTPVTKHVVAERKRSHVRDGVGAATLLFIAPFLAALALGLALVVLARIRTRSRAGTPAAPFSLSAAEYLAHAVRRRALAILGALAALAAYATTIASHDVVAVAFFLSPTLLVLALSALVRLIDATRAARLLRSDGASAVVRLDQIELTSARDRVTLRASRWLVDRSRRHAVPRASL